MVWVLLWGLLAGAARGDDHDDHNQQLSDHVQRLLCYPCRDPQPRAIAVEPLEGAGTDESVWPRATVLHRCDAAGFCDAGQVCAPAPNTTHHVTLWFRLTSKVNNITRLHSVVMTNHTRCACSLLKNTR